MGIRFLIVEEENVRPLEIVILLSAFVFLAGFFFPKRKRPRFFISVPFLSGILILIHLVLEKYRWQMVPAYVFVFGLVLFSLLQIGKAPEEEKPQSRGKRIMAAVLTVISILILIVVSAIPWLFPVVNLPKPTGPFAVGTSAMYFVDPSRQETLAEPPGGYRESMVRVWYPAKPASGSKPIPYWEKANVIGPIRVEDDLHKWGFTWIPRYFLNHFSLMKTNSYPDAPIAENLSSYPVIIFSPGGGVIHEHNFLHTEELASQGYVVISLSHPYESWAVIFPDGRVARGNRLKANKAPTKEEKDREKTATELTERLKISKSIEERKTIMREFFKLDPDGILDKLLSIRVQDVKFALGELQKINSGERASGLKGKLDMEHIGIFGMSLGGAVAGQACLGDERIKAGINLDGTQFGTLIDSTLHQPFMFMNSGESKDHNDFVYDRLENDGYSVIIQGSSHMDFTDMFFTMPIVKRFAKKVISDKRMYRVANAYILAFFNKYLKDTDSPLLKGPSAEYPEVTFRIIAVKK